MDVSLFSSLQDCDNHCHNSFFFHTALANRFAVKKDFKNAIEKFTEAISIYPLDQRLVDLCVVLVLCMATFSYGICSKGITVTDLIAMNTLKNMKSE